MSPTAARRGFGFLIAIAVAALPATIQSLPASAASTGTLFGIVISPSGVSKIDPASGALTGLADLSLPPDLPIPGFGAQMASDPGTHRLFLVRVISHFTAPPTTDYQLVTVDTRSGAVTATPSLSHPINQIAFDSSTGSLYALTGDCCPNQVVSVDPTTGVMNHVADVTGDGFSLMTVDPASHLLYVDSLNFSSFPASTLLTVNPATSVVTQTPLAQAIGGTLVFDPAARALFGITCCPFQLVRIDPVGGTETAVGNYDFGFFLEGGTAIDPATHTIYVVQDVFDPLTGPIAHIAAINDQTGAGVLGASTGANLAGLAFEPVAITPASIKADVQAALASGAIDNGGIANSLLVKLNAAAAERAAGRCSAAANHYNAFIHEVNAQSDKHIAAATAAQLVSEAQFLVANCP